MSTKTLLFTIWSDFCCFPASSWFLAKTLKEWFCYNSLCNSFVSTTIILVIIIIFVSRSFLLLNAAVACEWRHHCTSDLFVKHNRNINNNNCAVAVAVFEVKKSLKFLRIFSRTQPFSLSRTSSFEGHLFRKDVVAHSWSQLCLCRETWRRCCQWRKARGATGFNSAKNFKRFNWRVVFCWNNNCFDPHLGHLQPGRDLVSSVVFRLTLRNKNKCLECATFLSAFIDSLLVALASFSPDKTGFRFVLYPETTRRCVEQFSGTIWSSESSTMTRFRLICRGFQGTGRWVVESRSAGEKWPEQLGGWDFTRQHDTKCEWETVENNVTKQLRCCPQHETNLGGKQVENWPWSWQELNVVLDEEDVFNSL